MNSCSNCKHSRVNTYIHLLFGMRSLITYRCHSPALQKEREIHPVYGKMPRHYPDCEHVRGKHGECGPAGKLYEPSLLIRILRRVS